MNPIELQIESAFLRETARALLLLPSEAVPPRRLLTLLHGAGEGPEDVLNGCDLSAAVDGLRLAILLPALGNGFYLDWDEGPGIRSALLKELLPAAQARSGVPAAREANVVGGISMGGFGAVSLALGEPERFAAAFSLSGALELRRAAQLCRICALPVPGDLRQAALRPEANWETLLARDTCKPLLYLAWGDQDWFRAANRSFARQAAEQGLCVRAEESPGLHNWAYWQASLGPALDWAAGV